MGICNLCPRRCNVDRGNGQFGKCASNLHMRIARIAPHYWEEPCISGTNGSGAVFFSGCALGCIYCQNRQISTGQVGKEYTPDELARRLKELQQEGVHNINLVTAGHYIPQVCKALDLAELDIPVVYNSSGYELDQALALLKGRVQIFLPDYKYADSVLANRYSSAPDYSDVALNAIESMPLMAGRPKFDGNGLMTGGVIVRHLVLPGCVDNSMKALREIHTRFGDEVYVSIMNQYTPMPNVNIDELGRPVTYDEYELVLDYADHLGIKLGFVQQSGTASESYIPSFLTNE